MSDLISRAQQIKNETRVGANTAERVGSLFEDIIDYVGDGDPLNTTYSELTNLIQTDSLIEGKTYRITDYQTSHYVLFEDPIKSQMKQELIDVGDDSFGLPIDMVNLNTLSQFKKVEQQFGSMVYEGTITLGIIPEVEGEGGYGFVSLGEMQIGLLDPNTFNGNEINVFGFTTYGDGTWRFIFGYGNTEEEGPDIIHFNIEGLTLNIGNISISSTFNESEDKWEWVYVGELPSELTTEGSSINFSIGEASTLVYSENEYKSYDIEPIIVKAKSVNQLEEIATSELYPNDIIYYDYNNNNWVDDIAFCIKEFNISSSGINTNNIFVPNLKGVIYRRIYTPSNIDMPSDWRNITVRLWNPVKNDTELLENIYIDFPPEYSDFFSSDFFQNNNSIKNLMPLISFCTNPKKAGYDILIEQEFGVVLSPNIFMKEGEYIDINMIPNNITIISPNPDFNNIEINDEYFGDLSKIKNLKISVETKNSSFLDLFIESILDELPLHQLEQEDMMEFLFMLNLSKTFFENTILPNSVFFINLIYSVFKQYYTDNFETSILSNLFISNVNDVNISGGFKNNLVYPINISNVNFSGDNNSNIIVTLKDCDLYNCNNNLYFGDKIESTKFYNVNNSCIMITGSMEFNELKNVRGCLIIGDIGDYEKSYFKNNYINGLELSIINYEIFNNNNLNISNKILNTVLNGHEVPILPNVIQVKEFTHNTINGFITGFKIVNSQNKIRFVGNELTGIIIQLIFGNEGAGNWYFDILNNKFHNYGGEFLFATPNDLSNKTFICYVPSHFNISSGYLNSLPPQLRNVLMGEDYAEIINGFMKFIDQDTVEYKVHKIGDFETYVFSSGGR